MADNWTQSTVCRYFKNGICREGTNCRYLHVLSTTDRQTPPYVPFFNVTCWYFKQGTCKYGSQCHFRHSSESVDSSSVHDTSSTEISSSEQQQQQQQQQQQRRRQRQHHTSGTSNLVPSKEIKDSAKVAEEWVNAPEFIPASVPPVAGSSSAANESSCTTSSTLMPVSYAQAVSPSGQAFNAASELLCPYAEATGRCKKQHCTYLHGQICELCGYAALHPYNEELRKKHTNACVKQHEVDMELSFAIQRSREKSCGVCFETIMEKSSRDQRFGILPNCNHCFCLTCIRKWRQAKQFDNKITRACPECRVTSDFVCPSMYWVDTKEEKEKLIMDYKGVLGSKDCKYFNKGRGKCPFGNKCFYLHALPDGTKTDVGPPVRQRRNANSHLDILDQLILWDFFDERDDIWMYVNVDNVGLFQSDSEESDWSDLELSLDDHFN